MTGFSEPIGQCRTGDARPVVEATALGCGIAARQTATGIAGLVISSVLFLLAFGLTALVLVRSGYFQTF
jgi:hypothetical protein